MTAPAAFLAYLDALPGTVLSQEFRQRIAARERRGEYPFSRQNIYRVLFAAAPVLRQGWLTVAAQQSLNSADPALGTSLRCFRYLHAMLIAPSLVDRAAADTLDPIAVRAMRLATAPDCFCPPGAAAQGCAVSVELALRLATTLRQYADLRWLGQHDQGFAGKQPRLSPAGHLTYTRCFSRLPSPITISSLEITVTYQPPESAEAGFDPFRGEMILPPLRDSARDAHVAVCGCTLRLDESIVEQLLHQAITAVRKVHNSQPATAMEAETAVARWFSRELCDAALARGIDPRPWRAEIEARLSSAAPTAECLTEAYLDALAKSVVEWREMLCAGN